jgi:hypothetical protein
MIENLTKKELQILEDLKEAMCLRNIIDEQREQLNEIINELILQQVTLAASLHDKICKCCSMAAN